MKQMVEFAIYKGDSLFHIGTAAECAEKLGVKLASFNWYTTPTGKRRIENRKNPDKCMFIERLEDDEE